MNIAVIFAGGVGQRMKTNGIPKQFLEINNVPIIIHTLRVFENAKNIDTIVVPCIKTHIEYLRELVEKFNITKVKSIIEGGSIGQQSIINGLNEANKLSKNDNDIVLIHDGVRPIIDEDLINENIECVKKHSTAITCLHQRETTVISASHERVEDITIRDNTYVARAPQSFFLRDILEAENKSLENNDLSCVDSCDVMKKYGKYKEPYIVLCGNDNLKVTTPEDYYIVEALINRNKEKESK